ncbi:MAG: hypothetical protein ACLR43_06310 [Faecalibacillus faecis]
MLVKQTKQLSSELNIQEELSKEIFIKELIVYQKMKKNEKNILNYKMNLNIFKSLKSVALSLKDMSTYESKELKTSTKSREYSSTNSSIIW